MTLLRSGAICKPGHDGARPAPGRDGLELFEQRIGPLALIQVEQTLELGHRRREADAAGQPSGAGVGEHGVLKAKESEVRVDR